jgi:zinc transport system ATP-binding protein
MAMHCQIQVRLAQEDAGRRSAGGLRVYSVVKTVDTILDVRHLSVHFGQRHVLRDLSFKVERGTSLAILGPNGAGKTVLFRSLVGATPFEGTVRWAAGTRIGYVPQKLDLERDIPITGLDFLTARTALARGTRTDVSRVLTLVGIPPDVANQPIGVLSGGQFQRLLLAFALVGDPNALLLDEPTAGVDEPGQEQINELVSILQRDHALTVLFISHELTVVNRYATNVLCLSRGAACFGPPHTVLTPDLLRDIYGTDVHFHVHEHADDR